MQVSWGGPDERRTTKCSYCDAPFPDDDSDDDFMPLVMWTPEGWCAEFCEACQERWWGIRTFREPPDDEDPAA